MKQNWISRNWWLPVLFAGIGLSSFTLFDLQETSSVNPPQTKFKVWYAQLKDSVPAKDEEDEEENDWGFQFKTCDLDKAIRDMEREMEKARVELKNMDWKKMDLEMQKALKEIDQIDLEKIRREAEASIKSIDWEKMQKEIRESLKELEEVELPKIRLEMDKNIKKEMENLKLELERNKGQLKIESEKLKNELSHSMEKTMKEMEQSMQHAKTGLQELKKMTEEMEKDGLIKKGENAKIKYKDGELYINGKKQPNEITEKYRHYFKNNSIHLNFNDEDRDDNWI